jgi:HK97 family phage major capsid protein
MLTHSTGTRRFGRNPRYERKENAPGGDDLAKIISDLGKTFEDFKSSVDTELKEVKKRGSADVITVEQVQRINEALDKLTEAKTAVEKRADDLEKKMERARLSGGGDPDKVAAEVKAFNDIRLSYDDLVRQRGNDVDPEGLAAYRKGFVDYCRKGATAMGNDERKTMSVGGDPDGGFVVTPDVTGRIITRVFETSNIRSIASVQVIGTDALEGLRDTDEAGSGGWVSETGSRTETTSPQFGKYRIPVHELYAMPGATQQLLDDGNVEIEAWLAQKVADKLGRVEETAFVTGTGVGKPQGFTMYSTAATADSSRNWGVLEHVATGVSGDFAASNPADILFDLEVQFKPQYLNNAKWITRRTVIQKVRKFKDLYGEYIWQPGLQAGKPAELIGYPIVLAEDMPALAANSLSLALGDMSEAYQIVDRQGLRVLRDNLTQKPYVLFYTTRRVGGAVVQFEALKFVKFV